MYNHAKVVRDDLNTTIHVEVEARDAADARQQIGELRRELANIQEKILLLADWAETGGPVRQAGPDKDADIATNH